MDSAAGSSGASMPTPVPIARPSSVAIRPSPHTRNGLVRVFCAMSSRMNHSAMDRHCCVARMMQCCAILYGSDDAPESAPMSSPDSA